MQNKRETPVPHLINTKQSRNLSLLKDIDIGHHRIEEQSQRPVNPGGLTVVDLLNLTAYIPTAHTTLVKNGRVGLSA